MKRALIGIVSTLFILFLALVLYLSLADFSSYKSDIEEAVTEATGRQLLIDGEFVIEVFPLTFVAENITYANADWASDEPMLSARHMSMKIDGSSLFSGPTIIEEFRLRDVRLVLEENAGGDANWNLETRSEREVVDVDEGVPVILSFAQLENIEVVRRRPDIEDRVISLTELNVRTTDERMITVEGSGAVRERPATLSAIMGPVDNFGSGQDIDISLDADFGVLAASIEGNTGNPTTLENTEFDARLTSDDIGEVIDLLSLPIELAGELRVESTITSADGLPVIGFDARVDDLSSSGSVEIDGERMIVDAEVSSLPKLGEIAGISGLPGGPVSVSGEVLFAAPSIGLIDFSVDTSVTDFTTTLSAVIEGDRVTLDPFHISIGESDLSGALDIRTSEPLSISGKVQSKLLDLTPFTEDENAEPETARAPASGRFVLSEEPLPFDFLTAGIVDLNIGIDNFRNGPIRLQQVKSNIQLKDAVLQQDVSFSVEDGGDAIATLELASTSDSATLGVDLDVTDLRLRLGQAGQRSAAEIPVIGLQADIQSTGNSPHTIAAAANGKLIFTQGPGKVNNQAMGFFSADIITELLTALNPFAKSEPYSVWDCTVVGVNIVDGVASLNPVLAQSKKVTIVADGEINFNDESLDVGFNTKPRSGVGVSADMFLTPFIRLGGTIASPRIAIDKSGVLLEGGAALLTGGISFLVKGAADRATGAQDRCAAALAIAEGREIETEE